MKNVSNQISEAKEEFNELISRLDSTERGNYVLRYEYRLLEKQLKMRSRHADVANRQQLDAERQKLRLLVKKRIPGHSKAKATNHPEAVERRMSLMIKQLFEVEEENKILKEISIKKDNEIHRLKVELARMSSNEQNYGNLSMGKRNNHDEMAANLLESDKKIVCLKTKVECLKESKRTTEDHLENLKLINYELDNQLSTAKLKIKEAFQKVSFLEMELEDKSHHREDLEATCLELQLQLASLSGKDEVIEDLEQEGKPLENVLEMTANLDDNNILSHSLRYHMAAEDGINAEDLIISPTIKDIISTTDTIEPSAPYYDTCNTLNKVKNIVPWTLPIVPSKTRRKGIALLKKLLFRRKRGRNKKKLLAFALYKI
uniref:filament-like plant protein 7 n=1 Tax=Erigeron canadensis TaxID=72917 RepID=UPI001CB95F9F|nr:filament-like plant protein 7 [Erigeron canadensis]